VPGLLIGGGEGIYFAIMAFEGALARVHSFLLLAATIAVSAPPVVNREIDGLLATLRTSGCKFQRNGTWYDGPKAAEHLQEKRAWLDKRGKILSTEDFIRYAGTQSSLSGKVYAVKCPDRPQVSSEAFLQDALRKFRAQR
jgi:hypothetical protein